MTYIVQETQTTNHVTALVPPVTFTDQLEAESKYHLVLSAAAVSQVDEHACMLFTADGNMLMSKCYRHEVNQA